MSLLQRLLVFGVVAMAVGLVARVASHDYGDALTKSILFFEGQRSGKLPLTQRMTWRKDSALRDGFEIGVSLLCFPLRQSLEFPKAICPKKCMIRADSLCM